MILLGKHKVEATHFPDGTTQVWKLPQTILDEVYKENMADITWVYENDAEYIQVAQLKLLLDTYVDYVNLHMPFLPYGRQDKRIDNNFTFGLHAFARLINVLNFTRVTTIDSHNATRSCMINRLEDQSPAKYIQFAIDETKTDFLLFPDQGAQKRYGVYDFGINHTFAEKVRNQETGAITDIVIQNAIKFRNKRVLIVDDIADGGATFIGITKKALSKGTKEIYLYVTHGIFSRGLKPLIDAGISRIFTRNGEVKVEVNAN